MDTDMSKAGKSFFFSHLSLFLFIRG